MWATFPINIHLFCSFLFSRNFLIKKSLPWQNQIKIWMTCFFPHTLCIFFLLSSIWGTVTCCHQGSTWLIFTMQQVAHGSFWAYNVKYKTVCLQMRVTLFSTSSGKSEVYFFIYVYETVSYVLWIRNTRSTVELWLQDQDENLLLCVNKMLCWNYFTTN